MKPVGGTHLRTRCMSCGGSWQQPGDALIRIYYSETESSPPTSELLCETCIRQMWPGITDGFLSVLHTEP